MHQLIIAFIISLIGIAALAIVLERWPGRDRTSVKPALEQGPSALEGSSPEPARSQRLRPFPSSSQAGPVTAASGPAIVDARRETRVAAAEMALQVYQTEVCACDSTECIADLEDRHSDLLRSLVYFDPKNGEQRALLEGVTKCIELTWAREDAVDPRTPSELAAERERERRKIMLRDPVR
jgi:hypothetical protein